MADRYVKGSLFSPDKEQEAAAYLVPNRGPSADALFASGYFEAAALLAQLMIKNAAPVDTTIYPLVFLYRHAVELALKQLLRDFSAIAQKEILPRKKMTSTHDLMLLWGGLSPWLGSLDPSGDPDAPRIALDEVQDVISDFAKVDPDGQAARYDTDTKGKQTLNRFDSINIESLARGMALVHEAAIYWLREVSEERASLDLSRRDRPKTGP